MQIKNENTLFDMSPPAYRKPSAGTTMSDGSSLSLGGTGFTQKAGASTQTMSTDSSRAPFGELQPNTFEFKPMQPSAATAADIQGKSNPMPFSTRLKQQADSVATSRDQGPEPGTPATAESRDTSSAMPSAAPAATKRIVWSDILLWNEPLQSLVIFVTGLAAFWLLTWAAYGAHKMTLVSGLSYLLLLDVGLNFFRYFVSKPWHDKCLWGGAAQMKQFLTKVNSVFLHLAAAHDRYLSAVDPFVTLKVACTLWALAWIGRFISLWWCVLLAYLGAFTVPALYVGLKTQIHAVGNGIRAATLDKVDKAGLPRTVRISGAMAFVTVLFFTCSYTQFAIGFFVAATYVRTLLVPKEIDAFRTMAEPYTQSVHKAGKRISAVAENAFVRMSTGPASRTKSHFRHE